MWLFLYECMPLKVHKPYITFNGITQISLQKSAHMGITALKMQQKLQEYVNIEKKSSYWK